jgi:hypothetical protein
MDESIVLLVGGKVPKEKESKMTKTKLVGDVKVTLCLTEDEGLCVEDGGKWLLMCEDHGFILQDTNKSRLWSNADEVTDWCEVCKEKAGA